MKPPEKDIVRVESMDELRAGMTVWLFDNEPGFKARWFCLILIGPDLAAPCQIHGRLCGGCWKTINFTPCDGICARTAIRRGNLWRLRDVPASDESTTEKRREVVA